MADNDIQHIFGKFFDGETINTRKLQSGINKGEEEAFTVVRNIIKSGKYDNRIKKTKISDDNEGAERLNEGILCCVGRGGCCEYDLSFDDPHESNEHGGGGIEWEGCCNQGWPKGCCGPIFTWSVAQDDNGEMSEELKEEIKRIKRLLI